MTNEARNPHVPIGTVRVVRRHLTALTATFVAAFVAALTLAAGCGSDEADTRAETAGLPDTLRQTEGQEWVLDAADSSIDVPEGVAVTLNVEGDRVSGLAGCNSYTGPIEVGGDSVSIGQLAMTQMACEPAILEAEAAYASALQAADTIEVPDDRLVLTGSDDSRLSFTALDRGAALVGTWDVIQLATENAVEGVLAGTQPTVGFVEDGTLSADAGCNNGAGSWELDADRLTIGPLASTRMACDEPAGVMEQETNLFAALEASRRVQVAGDSLTLLREDGTITVVATASDGAAG